MAARTLVATWIKQSECSIVERVAANPMDLLYRAVSDMTLTFEFNLPGNLAQFRLPHGLEARLHDLLDKQDSGQPLSASERDEAIGLVEISDLLTVLKLQAERQGA